MANTQITAGLTYGSGSQKPKKKKSPVKTAGYMGADIDAPADSGMWELGEKEAQAKRIEERRKAKEKLARQKAQAMKQKPPKKKVKPANWEQMLEDRPKTPLTPEEYFAKIR